MEEPPREPRGPIVLVDDEPAVLDYIRSLLELEGYLVYAAASAHTAIEVFKTLESEVGLLLTDVEMPDMNGVVLAETICKRRPDLPVLFISGYTLSNVAALRNHPQREFLSKPFRSETLLHLVRSLLEAER